MVVLLNLGVGCLGSGVVGSAGHGGAVSVGVGLSLAARTSAVVLEVGALSLHFFVSSTSEKTVNIGAQLVRSKSGRSGDLVGLVLGILQNTLRQDVKVATLGQVVGSGNVKSHVDGFASRDVLERVVIKIVSLESDTDALEGDLSTIFVGNLDLLSGNIIKDRSSLEDADVLVTGVGNGGRDKGVASALKLDIQW